MERQMMESFRSTYGRAPDVVCHAPGRIEFIGNHTDYNGGTVLGVAIDRGITVAVASRRDAVRRLASDYPIDRVRVVEISESRPTRQSGEASWTNYPLGVIDAFPSFGLNPPGGFDYLVSSDLPVGSGLSSSAAIELATGIAFLEITGQSMDRADLVKLGRHAENKFVGVPCGILDQGVVGFGRKDQLVHIDCRELKFSNVALPPGLHFWIVNSHANHALVDGLYADRHRECMAAAEILGVDQLVDADIASLEAARAKMDPTLYRRARHVVEEIDRVRLTVEALGTDDIEAVGRLLHASHESSRDLFENSTPELDFLVEKLTELPAVYGARLTGGGFGGAVMVLTDTSFDRKSTRSVARAYEERFGRVPDTLHLRSADGARVL
jgi:galactokinase